jgi:hypothetical protein
LPRRASAPASRFVRTIDNALPKARFRSLRRAVEALSHERLRSTYQTAFWWKVTTPPSNQVERAAQLIAQHLTSSQRRRIVGCEWWLSRMRTSNVKVDFHVDHDIRLAEVTGKIRHPLVSSVLYLNRCRGGLLAVTDQRACADNPAQAPEIHDFDFVEPAPNRLALFDGRLTHGVLDSENEIPGKRRPRQHSLRLAVAMNFWTRVPVEAVAFDRTAHYRSLL